MKPYYLADDWHGSLRDDDMPDFAVYRRGEETPIATFKNVGDAREFRAYKNRRSTKVSGR